MSNRNIKRIAALLVPAAVLLITGCDMKGTGQATSSGERTGEVTHQAVDKGREMLRDGGEQGSAFLKGFVEGWKK